MRDTTSWLHAAEAGWSHPVSREWEMTASLFDLMHALNAKRRPKPYPRPWPDQSIKTYKPIRRMTAVEVTALLRPEVAD